MSATAHVPARDIASAAGGMPLVVRSVAVGDPGPLLALLPDKSGGLAWIRQGSGLVGWGEAARLDVAGADRFPAAQRWWDELTERAVVRDEVGLPGSGLVCLGSFAFADDPGSSALIVPSVVVGRRGDSWWVTSVSRGALPAAPPPLATAAAPRRPVAVTFADGSRSSAEWTSTVTEAVRRIAAGELDKVVLARDLVAVADAPVDLRWPLVRLAADYPGCWTFCVGVCSGRPRAAGTPRAGSGHLAGAGGHHPPDRR